MKKRKLLASLGLSLFGLALAAVPARATSYVQDDLLLAFYATSGEGSSTSVVFNIGQSSIYRDASGEFFLSIGSIATDLKNAFGDNWKTRGDVHWGVFGATYNTATGTDAAWTLYSSHAQTTIGTQSQAFTLGSASTQSQPATKIKDFGQAYATTGAASGLTAGVNPAASIQDNSADNDFGGYQTNLGATSFAYFHSALANFTGTTAGSVLDLFRLPVGASTAAGSYEGTFTIGDDGIVRYSTVPNPSPTPTPTATPAPVPGVDPAAEAARVAAIQKKISTVKKQLKAAKQIDDPARKKAQLAKLKKKLKKLKASL